MSNPAGEGADRFEPFRLDQLHLGGLQLFVRQVKLRKRSLQRFHLLFLVQNFGALSRFLFCPLPLDRATDNAHEHFAFELALHQVILCAFPNCLLCEHLLGGTGQHNDRQSGL